MKTDRSGFTLIELMIALAIIVILAGMVAINFGDSVRKSADAFTKGNMAAIRSAISIYYSNCEGKFPHDDLASLTTSATYLPSLPVVRLKPHHYDSTSVTTEGTPTESGTWSYNNDETSNSWGTLKVGCAHSDGRGMVWSSY